MFYGANVWDPVLIISQIVSIQCLFYLSLGIWQAVLLGPTLGRISVAYLFDWHTMHIHSQIGLLTILIHCANSFFGAAYVLWLVERAKKCLDFAATCYIFHLVFCCSFFGLPRNLIWWATNVGGFLVMALLGEWLCAARELRDIPINALRTRKESGSVRSLLPTTDPDLPPRGPAARTAAAQRQRPSASGNTQGVQMTAVPAGSSLSGLSSRDGVGSSSRKKMVSRGPSTAQLPGSRSEDEAV